MKGNGRQSLQDAPGTPFRPGRLSATPDQPRSVVEPMVTFILVPVVYVVTFFVVLSIMDDM